MGNKLSPGQFDCHAKALPDEPMFVLLARDPAAPFIVEQWANERSIAIEVGERPETDQAMVDEARACAQLMRDWRANNDGRWREPPAEAEIPQHIGRTELTGRAD